MYVSGCKKANEKCERGYSGYDCQFYNGCANNIICLNGGIQRLYNKYGECICDCDLGYEGENCELISRAKFLGLYSVISSCQFETDTFYISITANANEISGVFFNNFFNDTTTVRGIVEERYVYIPTQVISGYSLYGQGGINDSILILNYTSEHNDIYDSCHLIFIKQ